MQKIQHTTDSRSSELTKLDALKSEAMQKDEEIESIKKQIAVLEEDLQNKEEEEGKIKEKISVGHKLRSKENSILRFHFFHTTTKITQL